MRDLVNLGALYSRNQDSGVPIGSTHNCLSTSDLNLFKAFQIRLRLAPGYVNNPKNFRVVVTTPPLPKFPPTNERR